MAGSVFLVQPRRIFVAKDAEQQADKVPQGHEKAIEAPVAVLCNQLSPQSRWAERQDGQHDQANILATIFDWDDFSCACKGDEFVQTSADSGENIASYDMSVDIQRQDTYGTYRLRCSWSVRSP